jgi:hypothetical protein
MCREAHGERSRGIVRRFGVLAGTALLASTLLAVAPQVAIAADAPGAYNGRLLVSGYTPDHFDAGVHIFSLRPDGTGLKQLTTGAWVDDAPEWSPDQTKIIFSRRPVDDWNGGIYVMNADGSNVHVVFAGTSSSWNQVARWSPDATRLVVQQAMKGGPDDLFRYSNIAILDADGGNAEYLRFGERYSSPVWSPDGTRIAFHSSIQFAANPSLHLMDPDGSDDVDLYSDRFLYPMDWTDGIGAMLAVEEDPEDLTADYFLADPAGGSVDLLIDFPEGTSAGPARVSPDGSKLAYSYNAIGTDVGCDIYTVNADGSGPHTNLTTGISTCLTMGDWGSTIYPFVDILDSPFRADIAWIAGEGITSGCGNQRYCPKSAVTREQMASFLARALDLPPTATDFFTDDEASSHEADINRLAAAGITSGCEAGKYCPSATVTREQMASFLARAFELPTTGTDFFTDDEASMHEANINRLAAAGITSGCTATTYCPKATVTREQLAAFLHRALT